MLKRHCIKSGIEEWWNQNRKVCEMLQIPEFNNKGEQRRITTHELKLIKEVYRELRAGNPNKKVFEKRVKSAQRDPTGNSMEKLLRISKKYEKRLQFDPRLIKRANIKA